MPLDPIRVLQNNLRSFKSTLESAPTQEKNNRVSSALAAHYNSLREKAEAFPDLAEHLPPCIRSTTNFAVMGVSDVDFTDLMVYLNQLIQLTDMLEESHET